MLMCFMFYLLASKGFPTMSFVERIRNLKKSYSETSTEDLIKEVVSIAREINGCDAVLRVEEGVEDRDYADLYPDEEFIIDFAKLEKLNSSWRYLHHLFCNILLELNEGKPIPTYEASRKYSIADTLDNSEIEEVKPDTLEGRIVIKVIGDITL